MHHGSVASLIFLALLIVALSVGLLIYMLKEQNKYATVKYSAKHRIWLVPLGILLTFISLFVSGLIMALSHVHLGVQLESLNGNALMAMDKTGAGKIYLIIMMIFAPVIEEFFFRFMIVGPTPIGNHRVNKFVYGLRIAIGIILFGLLHVLHQFFVTGSITGTLINDLPYLVMGGLFTYFYVHTQDIRVSIAIHTIWDLTLIILIDLF